MLKFIFFFNYLSREVVKLELCMRNSHYLYFEDTKNPLDNPN